MSYLTILAQISEHHYIARDQDHLVRLSWGRFHATIHPDDFPLLVDIVEQWSCDQAYLSSLDQSFDIYLDRQGYIQLWIVDSGLRLRPAAFQILANLLRHAARHVSVWAVVGDELPHHIGGQDGLLRYISLPPESLN